MDSQDKLLGKLVLDLSKFKENITEVINLLKNGIDKSGLDIKLISDSEANKAIEKLKSIKKEIDASSDTNIDKEAIDSFVNDLVTKLSAIQSNFQKSMETIENNHNKVTKVIKKNNDNLITSEKEVIEQINSAGQKISQAETTRYYRDKKGNVTSIATNTVLTTVTDPDKKAAQDYTNAIANVDAKYKQMISEQNLSVESLKKLKSELEEIKNQYDLTSTALDRLRGLQATYQKHINNIQNPKSSTDNSI